MDTPPCTGWVFLGNLRPFLTAVGWAVGYPFDADDWLAISSGVREADAEAGNWYEYGFAGRREARLSLAADPGTSVVFVSVAVPAEVEAEVRMAIAIFQHFHFLGGTD